MRLFLAKQQTSESRKNFFYQKMLTTTWRATQMTFQKMLNKCRYEDAETLGLLKKNKDAFEVFREAVVAIMNGRLHETLREIEGTPWKHRLLQAVKTKSETVSGGIPFVPPEMASSPKMQAKQEGHDIMFTNSVLAAFASGFIFAATGSAIAAVAFAVSLPFAVYFSATAYLRSEFHLRRKYGPRHSTGYRAIDRVLMLSVEKRIQALEEIDKDIKSLENEILTIEARLKAQRSENGDNKLGSVLNRMHRGDFGRPGFV
ncbi:hypothetical protein FJZ26_01905 [Candidatus Parvarchaeota archaeon]|nr:hypothetical protein [Candidatus Parvarchaeota archaeon]